MESPRTYDSISPPCRPLNRLEAHHFAAVSKNRTPWVQEYEALIRELAWWNEMRPTESAFSLESLAAGRASWQVEKGLSFPVMDHVKYFKRGRRPVAILTEPYDPRAHATVIRQYAEGLGLMVHSPPNVYASFHFPGWTGSFLITRRDFGKVLWLEDQLMFETQGLVT